MAESSLTPEEVIRQRNILAHMMTATAMASDPYYIDIQPHSPTSSFDFAAGYSPAASTAAIGMFDPAGSSPTMQGGAPTATGRDAFSGAPAQDWGGVNDPFGNSPLAEPTMTAPDMTASPHATPTFDVDQTGMPSAPSFDNTPAAPGEQDASLSAPGAMTTSMAAMTTGNAQQGWGAGSPIGWGGAATPTGSMIDSMSKEAPMGVWDFSPNEAPGIPSLTPGVPSDPGVPGSGDLADLGIGDPGGDGDNSGDNSGSDGASSGVG